MISVPREIEQVLRRMGPGCLLHQMVLDGERVAGMICYTADWPRKPAPIPVHLRAETVRTPYGCVIWLRAKVVDDPSNPLYLESTINPEDPVQSETWLRLRDQQRLMLLFLDPEFRLVRSIAVNLPPEFRERVAVHLEEARRADKQIPSLDFDAAKAYLMREFELRF